MARLRSLLVWLLVFALPLQATAASSMMRCADLQTSSVSAEAPAHDHAAMMKAMAEDEQMPVMSHDMHAGMDHGDMGMISPDEQPIATTILMGCECGCECLASCSTGCATMAAVSILIDGYSVFQSSPTQVFLRRAEAHPAYCDDPLRPPSAVA